METSSGSSEDPATASAEHLKTKGNGAVAEKKWDAALVHYLQAMAVLKPNETSLRVILTSNISLVYLQLGKHQEALDEASKCMTLDPKFEKGYLRYAAALEAMNLKVTDLTLLDACPVMKTFRKGLQENPGSALLTDAMRLSFPTMDLSTLHGAAVGTTIKNSSKSKNAKAAKKSSGAPTKADREACVALDIRGATGQHELRINGRYDPRYVSSLTLNPSIPAAGTSPLMPSAKYSHSMF